MLGCLLALALSSAPEPRAVTVYPLRHPEGRDAEALALQQVLVGELEARGLHVRPGQEGAAAACTDERCLAAHQGSLVASWTRFGDGAVLTAIVADDRAHHGTFTVARPVQSDAELPAAASALADVIGDRLELPPPRSVPQELEHNSFGLALKFGNTLGNASPDSGKFSVFNLRFSLEGDYLAAPEFWPFVDLSVVLLRETNGQRVQLIPVLLGAKYVFRKGENLRPFAGMALGLNFLTAPLDKDTGSTSSFAVYGVAGIDWYLRENLALLADTSLNLNGLEASSGSGVLFAVGFNLGAVVLF